VVAAEDYRDDASAVHVFEATLYALVALLDEAGHHRHVAIIYDGEMVEDRDILGRVVGPEEVGDAANALGTESSTGPKRSAGVEGRPEKRGVSKESAGS
jgi:hypothetical protein